MTETLHIFDEFLEPEEELTIEKRHEKRMALEPFVFDILKKKYGSLLKESWLYNNPPKNTERAIVLIERRIHSNIEFVLQNAAYYAPTWSIAVVCSDTNYRYLKTITQGKNVALLPFFQGSPTRDQARSEYNRLLQSAEFYESLPWETMIFFQTDSYFLRPVPDEICEYDFIASPSSWDTDSMVGGISLRKRSAMIRICKEFKEEILGEDVYIMKGAKHLGVHLPPFEKSLTFFTESCLYDEAIATHQWWTYFFIDNRLEPEEREHFFKSLLTCELRESKLSAPAVPAETSFDLTASCC